MPKLKPGTKYNPETKKYEKPAEGGAVGGGALPPVNPQIKTILKADGSEDDFIASLGDGTAEPAEKKPRKPRTSKVDAAEVDPLMSDPLYRSYIQDMTGFGGPDLVSFACTATGKPMDSDEERRVNGLFYVAAKRSEIDPGKSWLALFIVAVAVIARLILARTDLAATIKKMFEPKPKEEKKPEPSKGSAYEQ